MIRRFVCLALAVWLMTSPCSAIYESEVDYTELMLSCALSGDWEMGQYAQFARGAKIAAEGLDEEYIEFEELFLLAKIIYSEAGSSWLSDEWKIAVGEVVLNRVASPLFPNSIAEVVFQPGQYFGVETPEFAALLPDRRCAEAALRLLQGERVLGDADVLFQANFVQGSRVHTAMYDSYLGWTYFCSP